MALGYNITNQPQKKYSIIVVPFKTSKMFGDHAHQTIKVMGHLKSGLLLSRI